MSIEQITTHLLLLIRRIALNQKCVRLHGFFGKGNIAGQTFVAVQIEHGYVVLGRAECDLRILIGEREAVCKGFLGDGLMIVIEQQGSADIFHEYRQAQIKYIRIFRLHFVKFAHIIASGQGNTCFFRLSDFFVKRHAALFSLIHHLGNRGGSGCRCIWVLHLSLKTLTKSLRIKAEELLLIVRQILRRDVLDGLLHRRRNGFFGRVLADSIILFGETGAI